MKRNDETFVSDILIAAQSIAEYMHGVSRATFDRKAEKRDAIIRQVGIVGEAASKLSAAFRATHESIPWRNIIGMRNIVIHQYWEVDLDLVWTTAKKFVPELAKSLGPIAAPKTRAKLDAEITEGLAAKKPSKP